MGFARHRPLLLLCLASLAVTPLARPVAAATAPPGFVIENAFPGLGFTQPVQVVFLPDGRRLVVETSGRVWTIRADGTRPATPFIDLRLEVLTRANLGLLGVAIDPDFSSNRWVYFLYTVDPEQDGVDVGNDTFGRLTRYRASLANPDVADLTSREVLIGATWSEGIPSLDDSHTIGTLRFAGDGTLLVSTGDGAHFDRMDPGGLDPGGFGPGRFDASEDIGSFRSQTLESLAGKILRVDKETGAGWPSNPFWNGNPTSERSRVWAYGLRNPYRFAVRPGTGSADPADGDPGTLFIGDVGWGIWEELDIVRTGGINLGWPCREGPVAQPQYDAVLATATPNPAVLCGATPSADNPSPKTSPSQWWHHANPANSSPAGWRGSASIGGTFYTGGTYPAAYHGRYVHADWFEAWIRMADVNAADAITATANFIIGATSVVDVTADPASGDLHYVTWAGNAVFRIRYVGLLAATPSPGALGAVRTGTSASLDVALGHPGAAPEGPVHIQSVSVSGDPAFSIVAPPALPASVAAGGAALAVRVAFAPTVVGPAAATLEIVHSGTNSPLLVPISGEGVAGTVSVGAIASCVTPASPCVAVPVVYARSDATPARGSSVTVTLSPELVPCVDPQTSIVQGDWLDGHLSVFQIIDRGGGTWVVDQAVLGEPCGVATGGTLFTLHVRGAVPDGVGAVTVSEAIVRDCANGDVSVAPGAGGAVTLDATPPGAIADLGATRVGIAGPAPGTLGIALAFTPPADAASVAVYRAPFGGYPEYDDAGGAAPPAPGNPPGPPWTLTGVSASGGVDHPPARDVWYYVALARDACGNATLSNVTSGTLDYRLGDAHDGVTACTGDNDIGTPDVSFLGAHYGATLGPADPRACLDVGPTLDFSPLARPTTDRRLDFEDLVLLALGYGAAPGPALAADSAPASTLAAAPAAAAALRLELGPTPAVGERLAARLVLESGADIRALSADIDWDGRVVEPLAPRPGALLATQAAPAVVLGARPGNVDVAVLGGDAALAGDGAIAEIDFRVVAPGDPRIRLARVAARDRRNRPVALAGGGGPARAPALPAGTAIERVHPNPFGAGANVDLAFARACHATLRAYDLAGREVATVLEADVGAGRHSVRWEGRDASGRPLATGLYLLRLEAAGVTRTARVQIVR